jgi:hypothetical protein
MNKFFYWTLFLWIAAGVSYTGEVVQAQSPTTVIRVLDASGVEGIAGAVLLVNPGDARKSVAFVTDAQGEAITHDLQCEICVVSAFDPRGLFSSRTTEFSGSSSSFRMLMQLRPLIDTAGDPKAVFIELVINNSKGEPLVRQNVVIRPTLMTLENNQLSVQRTDAAGHVNAQLRAGHYTVGVLNGNSALEVRFEIAATREECSGGESTCIVASPQSSRRIKPVSLQLPFAGLS